MPRRQEQEVENADCTATEADLRRVGLTPARCRRVSIGGAFWI